jgi:hypothetical protein
MYHTPERREIYTMFRLETLEERNHLEEAGFDGRITRC